MKTTPNNASLSCHIVAVTGLVLLAPAWHSSAEPKGEANEGAVIPQFLFIGGQVNVPQRYIYTNGMTLLRAIKMARGVTPEASLRKVTLTRNDGQPKTLDLQAIEQRKAKDIELRPGDRVFVPKK